MAIRNILHQSKLDAFKDWLVEDGWTICDPKGIYEVLRAKKNLKYLLIYRQLDAKEHYSVLDADCHIVRKFLASQKEKKEKVITNADHMRGMTDDEL